MSYLEKLRYKEYIELEKKEAGWFIEKENERGRTTKYFYQIKDYKNSESHFDRLSATNPIAIDR